MRTPPIVGSCVGGGSDGEPGLNGAAHGAAPTQGRGARAAAAAALGRTRDGDFSGGGAGECKRQC